MVCCLAKGKQRPQKSIQVLYRFHFPRQRQIMIHHRSMMVWTGLTGDTLLIVVVRSKRKPSRFFHLDRASNHFQFPISNLTSFECQTQAGTGRLAYLIMRNARMISSRHRSPSTSTTLQPCKAEPMFCLCRGLEADWGRRRVVPMVQWSNGPMVQRTR